MELAIALHPSSSFRTPFLYWLRTSLFLLPYVHAVLNPIIYYLLFSKNIKRWVCHLVLQGIYGSRKKKSTGCSNYNQL